MVQPNNLYKGIIKANVLNMTGGQMYNIGPFDPVAVKKNSMQMLEDHVFLNSIVNLEKVINMVILSICIRMILQMLL